MSTWLDDEQIRLLKQSKPANIYRITFAWTKDKA
jgi:hypothetical protein